jgi:hypothetical protein
LPKRNKKDSCESRSPPKKGRKKRRGTHHAAVAVTATDQEQPTTNSSFSSSNCYRQNQQSTDATAICLKGIRRKAVRVNHQQKKGRKKRRGTYLGRKWPPNQDYPHVTPSNTVPLPTKTINRHGEATDMLGPIEMAERGRFLPLWAVKMLTPRKMKNKCAFDFGATRGGIG